MQINVVQACVVNGTAYAVGAQGVPDADGAILLSTGRGLLIPAIRAAAVQNLRAYAGASIAYIYADAPAGPLPSGYSVTSTPPTSRQFFAAASQITPWIFTGLTIGVPYTLSVTPVYSDASILGVAAASNSITPQSQPVAINSVRNPLALWLCADKVVNNAGTSQPANAAAIASWLDASGNGYSAPSSASAATTMLTSWINGKSAVALSGAGSGFLPPLFTTGNLGSAFTIFMAMQSTLSGVQQFVAGVDAPTAVAKNGFNVDANGTSVRAWSAEGAFILTETAAANTPLVLEVTFPGNLYINGTKQATANQFLTAIPKNAYPWQIGNNPHFGNNMIGDIGTLLVYRGVLSSADRLLVRQFLASYYGITVNTTPESPAIPGIPV